ncbi:hypothetical protein CEXT_778361 [Caerostris extrusa]|uniref:Uncharacterized protein n=1 Tax=Caerostris extrusa TaxID=172846 RepID=A0AAV4UGG7_CAEEX|nr:hypothetical protein CEXT_778361 [Caerostris extrusa]
MYGQSGQLGGLKTLLVRERTCSAPNCCLNRRDNPVEWRTFQFGSRTKDEDAMYTDSFLWLTLLKIFSKYAELGNLVNAASAAEPV